MLQKLVGVLSQRDLALIETLKDVDRTKVTVDDVMSTVGIFTTVGACLALAELLHDRLAK